MRIFILELNNNIKGIDKRMVYIESLISKLSNPDLVLLPELAIPSYMPNYNIWEYADKSSEITIKWSMEMAKKYNCFIGVGYADYDKGNYYNRYLIADKNKVYGIITKSEGEAAVFKRGWFDNVVKTPFGNVAIGICYDSRRKHFYENIKDEKLSLIVFPHGSSASSRNKLKEQRDNDYLCNTYSEAFCVPVIYINSRGSLEHMPGIMGFLMKLFGFSMNGKSKIYACEEPKTIIKLNETQGYDVCLSEKVRKKDVSFYGNNLIKGNIFFKKTILKIDVKMGISKYKKTLKKTQDKR